MESALIVNDGDFYIIPKKEVSTFYESLKRGDHDKKFAAAKVDAKRNLITFTGVNVTLSDEPTDPPKDGL